MLEPTNQPKGTTMLLRHDYIPGKISPKPLNQNSDPMSSGEGGYYLVLWQASKGGTSRPQENNLSEPNTKVFWPQIKVSSDASAQGLGASLEQLNENEWHLIA